MIPASPECQGKSTPARERRLHHVERHERQSESVGGWPSPGAQGGTAATGKRPLRRRGGRVEPVEHRSCLWPTEQPAQLIFSVAVTQKTPLPCRPASRTITAVSVLPASPARRQVEGRVQAGSGKVLPCRAEASTPLKGSGVPLRSCSSYQSWAQPFQRGKNTV